MTSRKILPSLNLTYIYIYKISPQKFLGKSEAYASCASENLDKSFFADTNEGLPLIDDFEVLVDWVLVLPEFIDKSSSAVKYWSLYK